MSADQLLQQGIQEYSLGNTENALNYWNEAYALYQEQDNPVGQTQVLKHLGLGFDLQGNYEKALDYYMQSLDLARQANSKDSEIDLLKSIGLTFYAESCYDPAISYLEQGLKIASEIESIPSVFELYCNLGDCYFYQNLPAKCIEHYQKALGLRQQLEDPNSSRVLQTLLFLGTVYLQNSMLDEALPVYQDTLSIARLFQNQQLEYLALSQIAQVYIGKDQYDLVIPYTQEGLALTLQLDALSESVSLYSQLGDAYLWLNNYALAIDAYQAGLEIARTLDSRDREVNFLNKLGDAFYYVGETDLALESFNNALQISVSLDSESEQLNALHGLAKTQLAVGQLETAQLNFEATLILARQLESANMEANALNGMGVIFSAQGNFAQALARFQECLEIYRRIGNLYNQASTLDKIGLTYSLMGLPSQAIPNHEQSLALMHPINETYSEARSLELLGYCYFKLNNLDKAVECLFSSLGCSESIRGDLRHKDSYSVSFSEGYKSSYRTLQKILIANGQSEAALEISERGRARAFVELLARRLSTNISEPPPVPHLSLSQIQNIASTQNATLVEYSLIEPDFKIRGKTQNQESELYIWVITPAGKITFRNVNFQPFWQQYNLSLEELVAASRESMGLRGRGFRLVESPSNIDPTERLKQLYNLLIDPIADLLPTDPDAHVVIMPQGELFSVPFPALQDAQGKYLIEKHTLLTAPAIQALELTHQQWAKVQQAGMTDIVIVGNPTMPKVNIKIGQPAEQLAPLPGAEVEACEIAELLSSKAMVRDKATESAILPLLPQARIIHFATHGLLDDFDGLGVPGAIALAPNGTGELNDGLLTANEILSLNLNAELVVLSACDTGRGRITGDGVIGLSRSLIMAGVPCVLVSLWSVPDTSTAELMTEFYRFWHQQKLGKAQALRQAMLKTKKSYPNPRDWAAFTLIGQES